MTPKDTELLKQLLVVLSKLVNEPKGKQRQEQPKTPEGKSLLEVSGFTKINPFASTDSFSRFSLDSGRDVSIECKETITIMTIVMLK